MNWRAGLSGAREQPYLLSRIIALCQTAAAGQLTSDIS